MSINYYTYVIRLAQEAERLQSDVDYSILIPASIDYAEQRLYRELDLLVTRITDTSATASSGVRTLTLPTGTGTFLVVEGVNVSTAVGAPRSPVTFVSREFVDAAYPGVSVTGLPLFVTMASNTQLIFGPAPDKPYNVEIVGTQRPSALSSGNSSTFLTQVLPDLFLSASLIYVAEAAQDPTSVARWQAEYDKLFTSARVEEVRKQYRSQGWTPMSPSPTATPQRV